MPVTISLQSSIELGKQLDAVPADALERAWVAVGNGQVEALEAQPAHTIKVLGQQNLLVEAVRLAFFQHYPLVLSPDVIWVTIMQGLANHVAQDPEAHRTEFVAHEGKQTIKILRDEFAKGSRANDWVPVLDEFAEKIGQHVGKAAVQCLSADFTTSGAKERAVAAVTLMDTVQHYFTYRVVTRCGFPSITLTGAVEDWESVRAKAERLRRHGLGWWLEVLLPVLDQFVAAAGNRADPAFWNSLCNVRGGSGDPGSPLTGWIQALYPYLNGARGRSADTPSKMRKNPGMDAYKPSFENDINMGNFVEFRHLCGSGIHVEEFPPAVAAAPFVWEVLKREYNMKFMGGVACIVQDPKTLALRPELSWGILDLGERSAFAWTRCCGSPW